MLLIEIFAPLIFFALCARCRGGALFVLPGLGFILFFEVSTIPALLLPRHRSQAAPASRHWPDRMLARLVFAVYVVRVIL
jgi:hypothetical protein